MSGKKHANKERREAHARLWQALGSGQYFPQEWYEFDFYCPEKRIAIRLRDGQDSSIEEMERQLGEYSHLGDFDVCELWIDRQQVLEDFEGVLERIAGALAEGEDGGWDPDEDLEAEESPCPMFEQVELPMSCRYCRNCRYRADEVF